MFLNNEIKEKIINNILKTVSPVKIILFGSYATGSATEESDLDILIIEKKVISKIKEKSKIRKALKDIELPKDILVTDAAAFEFYKSEYGSVYKEAYEKGEILWSI